MAEFQEIPFGRQSRVQFHPDAVGGPQPVEQGVQCSFLALLQVHDQGLADPVPQRLVTLEVAVGVQTVDVGAEMSFDGGGQQKEHRDHSVHRSSPISTATALGISIGYAREGSRAIIFTIWSGEF